ncbi:MAG TPA: CHRD domain-containing protein, partial [Dehalococcoidia bacterium]|nr:CHRD domain-containing protein [Dehalococcoidia bacterium]
THAWGFVRFFFNDDRTEANYTVDVKGIGQNVVIGADMHVGAPGSNGPLVRHLADGGFIVTAGRLTLTPTELAGFTSGNWYVVLKTVDHPEGEIRGQVVVPADFLPASPPAATPPAQRPAQPPSPAQAASAPGFIQPPSTGDAGLR